jgi:hypothetical protein
MIPAGGLVRGRKLSGLCGVTMKDVWSKATVSFTEDWPSGGGKTARHIWHVVVQGRRVVATLKGANIAVASVGEGWEYRRHGLLIPLPRCARSARCARF